MRVLMLNASWEPLRVIPLKRAVVLILQEKAEVVEQGKGVLRSQKMEFPIPEVIRLKRYISVPYKAKIPLTNKGVLKRDNFKCVYCKTQATEVDHVVPRSRGGKNEWENMVASCRPCNAKKDNKTLEELGWRLDFKPFAPKGRYWFVVGLTEKPSWEPFLAST